VLGLLIGDFPSGVRLFPVWLIAVVVFLAGRPTKNAALIGGDLALLQDSVIAVGPSLGLEATHEGVTGYQASNSSFVPTSSYAGNTAISVAY
jgi:hypothetical protein